MRRPLTRTLELEQERLALVTRHFGDVSLSAITANAIADFQRARHAAGIANRTELAEMGVADHVLESISGHLSRRMLEHYSHIRIDAKRRRSMPWMPRGARPRTVATAIETPPTRRKFQ